MTFTGVTPGPEGRTGGPHELAGSLGEELSQMRNALAPLNGNGNGNGPNRAGTAAP